MNLRRKKMNLRRKKITNVFYLKKQKQNKTIVTHYVSQVRKTQGILFVWNFFLFNYRAIVRIGLIRSIEKKYQSLNLFFFIALF